MIPRTPPPQIRYVRNPLFAQTKRFKRGLKMLIDDQSATLPGKWSVNELIQVQSEWMELVDPRHTRAQHARVLEAEWNDALLQVAAPTIDKPTEDLIEALLQPEGREFCALVMSERVGTRGGGPGLWFTLLVAFAWAGLGTTMHINHAVDIVLGDPRWLALGSELASACEGPARCIPAPISYPNVTRRLQHELAPGFADEVKVAIAQIVAQFASWGYPVGRYLVADGTLIPAWTQQKSAHVNGKWNPEREAWLRRRAPQAGYVSYSRDYVPDGLDQRAHAEQIKGPARMRLIIKAVRGYCFTALTCLATGIVLTFDLQDATTAHEPRVLREILLPNLFTAMPYLEVDAIVGDAKYDDDATHAHLETHYGIHPVIVRRKKGFARPAIRLREEQHKSIRAIRADGTAICRGCGGELEYVQFEPSPAKRKQLGLVPGQRLDPRLFRIRLECPNGCGKFSVAASTCWSHMPHYPRKPRGRPALYARRWALLHHRNQAESTFSSQKRGNKVGLAGAARTSIYSFEETEMQHSIFVLTKALLRLRAERMLRGELAS